MPNENIALIRVDPLDPHTGLAFPNMALRIRDFMREHFSEGDPDTLTRQLLARVALGDPTVFLLAMIDVKNAKVVGHLLCTLEQAGAKKWVYGWQAEVEGKQDDLLNKAFGLMEIWAGPEPKEFAMTTARSERAWERKYGFKSLRHVMSRPIPYKEGD